MSDSKLLKSRDKQNSSASISVPEGLSSLADLELDKICMPPQNKSSAPESSDEEVKKAEDHNLFEQHPIDKNSLQGMALTGDDLSRNTWAIHAEAESSDKDHTDENLLRSTQAIKISTIPDKTRQTADRIEVMRLRENIFKELPPGDAHVLLLLSPNDKTGQTMTIASLGLNIATVSDKSVLLMDCNMYDQSLHTCLGYEPLKGLTEMIADNLSWRQFVTQTEQPNLYLLSSGIIPLESFTKLPRNYFRNLFTDLKNSFDIVIVDSTSTLRFNKGNIDTLLLTTLADYSILNLNMNGTTKKQLIETQDLVLNAKGNINSIICNHLPAEPISGIMLKKLKKRLGLKNNGC